MYEYESRGTVEGEEALLTYTTYRRYIIQAVLTTHYVLTTHENEGTSATINTIDPSVGLFGDQNRD